CSQLIHTRFVVVLASGLEIRNQLRKRQEKNEFNFQLLQKNSLDGKLKRACRRQKEKQFVGKFSWASSDGFGIAATNRIRCWLAAHPELTELVCARNFSPLRAERKRSANCRCRQPIPIPPGVFRCALRGRTRRRSVNFF